MKLKVLLVDDDEQVRFAVGLLLAQHDVQVVTAADGLDAVERLRQEPPGFDLVISDIEMPRLSGWELLKWVRHRYTALPVVLMSGMSGSSFVKAAYKLGAYGALEKPLLACHLRKLMKSLFEPEVRSGESRFYYPPSLMTQISLAAVCA